MYLSFSNNSIFKTWFWGFDNVHIFKLLYMKLVVFNGNICVNNKSNIYYLQYTSINECNILCSNSIKINILASSNYKACYLKYYIFLPIRYT